MNSIYVFTPKCGSPICHVLLTDCTNHAQTKLSSICRHKPIVTCWSSGWALMKRQVLLTFQAKLKLAIIISSIFFFTFCSRRLRRNPRKRVTRGGKVLKTLLHPNISNYLFAVKLRVEQCEALAKEATERQLISDINRDMPKIDTVFLRRRKYLSKPPTEVVGQRQ